MRLSESCKAQPTFWWSNFAIELVNLIIFFEYKTTLMLLNSIFKLLFNTFLLALLYKTTRRSRSDLRPIKNGEFHRISSVSEVSIHEDMRLP
jgi:hypothetical protein